MSRLYWSNPKVSLHTTVTPFLGAGVCSPSKKDYGGAPARLGHCGDAADAILNYSWRSEIHRGEQEQDKVTSFNTYTNKKGAVKHYNNVFGGASEPTDLTRSHFFLLSKTYPHGLHWRATIH